MYHGTEHNGTIQLHTSSIPVFDPARTDLLNEMVADVSQRAFNKGWREFSVKASEGADPSGNPMLFLTARADVKSATD